GGKIRLRGTRGRERAEYVASVVGADDGVCVAHALRGHAGGGQSCLDLFLGKGTSPGPDLLVDLVLKTQTPHDAREALISGEGGLAQGPSKRRPLLISLD